MKADYSPDQRSNSAQGSGTLARQRAVGDVINRLLTDEDLRVRFVLDRVETLAELMFRGFDLSPDDIDLFVRSDARLWWWCREIVGELVH